MQYRISKEKNLFSLGTSLLPLNSNFLNTTLYKLDFETLKWHYCLGHLNIRSLTLIKTNNLVTGIPSIKTILPPCEGCIFGKQSKTSYPTTTAIRATVLLALIHTDLYGPMSMPLLWWCSLLSHLCR